MATKKVVWRGATELEQHLVPVKDLTPFEGNPMRYSQVHLIGKSLREFGQTRPILTWANAEDHGYTANTIVGGHHVWLAAKDEKWTHVAVIPSEFDDEEAARKYLVLDNVLSQRTAEELAGQTSLFDVEKAGYLSDDMVDFLKHAPRMVPVAELKENPANYRKTTDELVQHKMKQLEEFGVTEMPIIARDGTVLVGEGVMKAAALLGWDKLPVQRVDVDADSPEAKKIILGSQEHGKRMQDDGRALSEMLREVGDELGLEGTGYNEQMLANLALITRSAAEIKDANQAMEWVGLSEYEKVALPIKVMVSFENEEERDKFLAMLNVTVHKKNLGTVSIWWPEKDREDPHSLRFQREAPEGHDELLAELEAEELLEDAVEVEP